MAAIRGHLEENQVLRALDCGEVGERARKSDGIYGRDREINVATGEDLPDLPIDQS